MQPHGISLIDNVYKECQEEAGVPLELARHASPVGAVSYVAESPQANYVTIKRDVLFCFDLHVPPEFEPEAVDGEVEEFMLWPMQRVMDAVAFTDEYKDNCNLVLIDLFLRLGLVSPDLPGYIPLLHGLRNPACM
jgi:8-oxo-dGTP pyrophosphatase MutT (NUDIX family)